MNFRVKDFLRPRNQPALVVDTSAGLSLGAQPGLEDFSTSVKTILTRVSGLVCSPGQISKLGLLRKEDAGLLVRMDWSNTLRQPDFVLPPSTHLRIPILSAEDALELGASGMVTTILLGYDEEVEADSVRSVVQLTLAGRTLGLPLLAEVQATGARVSLYGKAVELGASYALEGGAEVIVVPYPGTASLKTLGKFVSVPWLVKPTSLQTSQVELEEALSAGAAGLWLGHTIFTLPDPAEFLSNLRIFKINQSDKPVNDFSSLPPAGKEAVG